jgi:hypothetical protein
MCQTPDSRVPKIFSRQFNGTRSMVQNSFSINGPDPLSLFETSRLLETTSFDLVTLDYRGPKIICQLLIFCTDAYGFPLT